MMTAAFANPFETKFSGLDREVLDLFLREKKSRSMTMGDFWGDVGSFFTDAVAGLSDALAGAMAAIVHTVEQIGETIALIVRACVGDVKWSDVLDSIGKVFQDIGTAMVFLDPTRQVFNWLSKTPLTAHAFHELDKFTGGWLTDVNNLSTLPGRVLRGDAISKYELIKDALFVLEVVVMIVTFPEGLAMMVGLMVGRNVCSHQTEAREACMGAFTIASMAVGDWAGSGDTFLEALENSGETFLESTGINIATRELVKLCQQDQMVGSKECQVLGNVLADYLKSDGDVDWATFLGKELVKIGEADLLLDLYPPKSPEHAAIVNHMPPKPKPPLNVLNIPGASGGVVGGGTTLNPLTYVLLAAGAASILIGGS